tara:strand:- start:5100 stop:5885 length:786 start_codon:yes stop_codon:yes gene_type:complete
MTNKLFKTGKLYIGNLENKFTNNKIVNFSPLLINLLDLCIDYVKSNINTEYLHSIYVRGSCLDGNIKNKNIFDLDINVVFKDDTYRHELLNQEHKEKIRKKMQKLYNFSIHPDIAYFSIPLWVTDQNCYINRFFAKKIYGEEDLSLTEIDLNKLLEFYRVIFDYDFNYFMEVNLIKDKNDTLRIIKRFYRSFGIIELLNNKMYSRDIYYCHNILIKNYPKHENALNEIINIFLNPKDCNNLEKYKSTINTLYHQICQTMKV